LKHPPAWLRHWPEIPGETLVFSLPYR
jgi:hypothetical protein